MPKKRKKKKSINNWRQREYLKIGVVMLPKLKTEREVVMNYLRSDEYKEKNL